MQQSSQLMKPKEVQICAQQIFKEHNYFERLWLGFRHVYLLDSVQIYSVSKMQ